MWWVTQMLGFVESSASIFKILEQSVNYGKTHNISQITTSHSVSGHDDGVKSNADYNQHNTINQQSQPWSYTYCCACSSSFWLLPRRVSTQSSSINLNKPHIKGILNWTLPVVPGFLWVLQFSIMKKPAMRQFSRYPTRRKLLIASYWACVQRACDVTTWNFKIDNYA